MTDMSGEDFNPFPSGLCGLSQEAVEQALAAYDATQPGIGELPLADQTHGATLLPVWPTPITPGMPAMPMADPGQHMFQLATLNPGSPGVALSAITPPSLPLSPTSYYQLPHEASPSTIFTSMLRPSCSSMSHPGTITSGHHLPPISYEEPGPTLPTIPNLTIGSLINATGSSGATNDPPPPSPSERFWQGGGNGPTLPPINELELNLKREGPMASSSFDHLIKKRKLESSPTHSLTVGNDNVRPEPQAQGYQPLSFESMPKQLSPPPSSSATNSTSSSTLKTTNNIQSTPSSKRAYTPGLAPMRRLDYHSGDEAGDESMGDPKDRDDEGDQKDRRRGATPRSFTPSLHEVSPEPDSPASESSDSNNCVDTDYMPLSSIRSRGIGRIPTKTSPRKTSSPAKTAAKAKPAATKPVTRAGGKKINLAPSAPAPASAPTPPPATKVAAKAPKTGKKASKFSKARVSAGERRMSQNRSAQKKYRDKNKRLADLHRELCLELFIALKDRKNGNITLAAMEKKLDEASNTFRDEIADTCGMTAQRFEDDLVQRGVI